MNSKNYLDDARKAHYVDSGDFRLRVQSMIRMLEGPVETFCIVWGDRKIRTHASLPAIIPPRMHMIGRLILSSGCARVKEGQIQCKPDTHLFPFPEHSPTRTTRHARNFSTGGFCGHHLFASDIIRMNNWRNTYNES